MSATLTPRPCQDSHGLTCLSNFFHSSTLLASFLLSFVFLSLFQLVFSVCAILVSTSPDPITTSFLLTFAFFSPLLSSSLLFSHLLLSLSPPFLLSPPLFSSLSPGNNGLHARAASANSPSISSACRILSAAAHSRPAGQLGGWGGSFFPLRGPFLVCACNHR